MKAFKKHEMEEYTYDLMCQAALDAQKKYNLNAFQTNCYNYLCQGDFAARNDDLQLLFDVDHEGIGWDGCRSKVESMLKPLLKHELIVLKKGVRDCRDGRYTSWYFYDPRYKLENLSTNWQASPQGIRFQRFLKASPDLVEIAVERVYRTIYHIGRNNDSLDSSDIFFKSFGNICSLKWVGNNTLELYDKDKNKIEYYGYYHLYLWGKGTLCLLAKKGSLEDCIYFKHKIAGEDI